MSANYDIPAEQGSDLSIHLKYLDENGNPIDLTNYKAKLEVKRSYGFTGALATITSTPFGATVGVSGGFGGITLNCSIAGATGSTGGMLLYVSGVGMANLPVGKFVYDLQLSGVSGDSITRIIEGRFDSSPRVTVP